jgi:eukaryotic-like serine/threonine-protein kinase
MNSDQMLPGTNIGKYKILTHLASGGMASVYLARSFGAAGFSRIVAIKKPHQQILADKRSLAMFMDEARLAARIHHPNVVSTLDLELEGDVFYMIMEFIEGDGLSGLLSSASERQEPMPIPIALRIIIDALHGLHAAHELRNEAGEFSGIVHRDVSPQNILVGVDGLSRITDFGIAQARERAVLTNVGELKGKFAYMSPEQASAQPIDRRTDIFAAAVVLWECLAARRLFHAENYIQLIAQVCLGELSSIQAHRQIPKSLEAVLYKALSRTPDERFESALLFAEALEASCGAENISNHNTVGQWARRLAEVHLDRVHQAIRGETPKVPEAKSAAKNTTTQASSLSRTPRRAYPSLSASPRPIQPSTPASDYLQYFGLSAPPFSEAKQPQLFWNGGPFAEALSALSADLPNTPSLVVCLVPKVADALLSPMRWALSSKAYLIHRLTLSCSLAPLCLKSSASKKASRFLPRTYLSHLRQSM